MLVCLSQVASRRLRSIRYRVGCSLSTIILAKILAIPNCYLVVLMRQSHLSIAKCYVVWLLPNATSRVVRVRACDARLSCALNCHVLRCESASSLNITDSRLTRVRHVLANDSDQSTSITSVRHGHKSITRTGPTYFLFHPANTYTSEKEEEQSVALSTSP
jgi:hypothetical protein